MYIAVAFGIAFSLLTWPSGLLKTHAHTKEARPTGLSHNMLTNYQTISRRASAQHRLSTPCTLHGPMSLMQVRSGLLPAAWNSFKRACRLTAPRANAETPSGARRGQLAGRPPLAPPPDQPRLTRRLRGRPQAPRLPKLTLAASSAPVAARTRLLGDPLSH